MASLLISLLFFTVTSADSTCLSIFKEDSLKFLQYSGKGINELGKYNECLRQEMQYRLLVNSVTDSLNSIRLGICLPKSCDIGEINVFLQAKGLTLIQIPENNLTFFGLIYLILFLSIISTTLISTFLHCYSEKFTSYKLVKCFTAVDSLQTLMKIRANNKFGCINGLKVLSFIWVIYGHCFVMKLSSSIINLERLADVYQHWWGVVGYGGFYAVDIFFYLTGLLLSYFLLLEFERKQGKIQWGLMYLHRVLRILPTFAFVLGFYYFILPLLGSGPLWNNVREYGVVDCDKYWWTNFLFINNFVPDGKGNDCFGIGWYLANDMQFFLVGPLLVLLYFRVKNKGKVWGFFAALILLFLIVGYAVAYDLNIRVNILDKMNQIGDDRIWFQWFYVKPYIRFIPYLQGIMTGIIYIYYDKISEKQEVIGKDPVSYSVVKLVTQKKIVSIGMVIIGTFLMYYFVVFQQPVYDDVWNSDVWSRNTNALALSVARFGFISGLTLFILPVMMNQASYINNFLGNPIFEPIAKISYCGFLAHFAILLSYYSSQNNTLIEGIYVFRELTTFFPLVLLAALFIYICAEIPSQNLEKLLFQKSS